MQDREQEQEEIAEFYKLSYYEDWRKAWLWATVKVLLESFGLHVEHPQQLFIANPAMLGSIVDSYIHHGIASIKWQDVHSVWNERMQRKNFFCPVLNHAMIEWSKDILHNTTLLRCLLHQTEDLSYHKLGYSWDDMLELYGVAPQTPVIETYKTCFRKNMVHRKSHAYKPYKTGRCSQEKPVANEE